MKAFRPFFLCRYKLIIACFLCLIALHGWSAEEYEILFVPSALTSGIEMDSNPSVSCVDEQSTVVIDNPPRLNVTITRPEYMKGKMHVRYYPSDKLVAGVTESDSAIKFAVNAYDCIIRCSWAQDVTFDNAIVVTVHDLLTTKPESFGLKQVRNKMRLWWVICRDGTVYKVNSFSSCDANDNLGNILEEQPLSVLAFLYSFGVSNQFLSQALVLSDGNALSIPMLQKALRLLNAKRKVAISSLGFGIRDEATKRYQKFIAEKKQYLKCRDVKEVVEKLSERVQNPDDFHLFDEVVVIDENDEFKNNGYDGFIYRIGQLGLGVICRSHCYGDFPEVYFLTVSAIDELRKSYLSVELTPCGYRKFISLLGSEDYSELLGFYNSLLTATPETVDVANGYLTFKSKPMPEMPQRDVVSQSKGEHTIEGPVSSKGLSQSEAGSDHSVLLTEAPATVPTSEHTLPPSSGMVDSAEKHQSDTRGKVSAPAVAAVVTSEPSSVVKTASVNSSLSIKKPDNSDTLSPTTPAVGKKVVQKNVADVKPLPQTVFVAASTQTLVVNRGITSGVFWPPVKIPGKVALSEKTPPVSAIQPPESKITEFLLESALVKLTCVCPFCSYIVSTGQALQGHIQGHSVRTRERECVALHKGNYVSVLTSNIQHWINSKSPDEYADALKKWGKFGCLQCTGVTYINRAALNYHMKRDHVAAPALPKKPPVPFIKVPEACFDSVKNRIQKKAYLCPFCAKWCGHDGGGFYHITAEHQNWVQGLEKNQLSVAKVFESGAWFDYLTLCCSGDLFWKKGDLERSVGQYGLSKPHYGFKTPTPAIDSSIVESIKTGNMICPRCSEVFSSGQYGSAINQLEQHFAEKHSRWFKQVKRQTEGNFRLQFYCVGSGFLTVLQQCYAEKVKEQAFNSQSVFDVYEMSGKKYAIRSLGELYTPPFVLDKQPWTTNGFMSPSSGVSYGADTGMPVQLKPELTYLPHLTGHTKTHLLEPPSMGDIGLKVEEDEPAPESKTVVDHKGKHEPGGKGIPWDEFFSETYKPLFADTEEAYVVSGVEYPFERKERKRCDPAHDSAFINVLSPDLKREYAIINLIDAGSEAKTYYCRKVNRSSQDQSEPDQSDQDEFKRFVIRVEDRSNLQVKDWEKRQVGLLRSESLKHEHLVEIYQQCFYDDKYYQVMEYLPQGIDELYGDETYLEDIEAWWITQAVASAINHLHQNGIAHRDVKPDNIRIGFDGRVRLFDYGIMKYVGDSDGMTKSLAYTPAAVGPMLALDLVPDGDEEVISNAYKQDYVALALLQVRLHTGKWIIDQQANDEPIEDFKHRARCQIFGGSTDEKLEQKHIVSCVETAYRDARLLKAQTHQDDEEHIKHEIDFVIQALSYGLDVLDQKPVLLLKHHSFITSPPS